MSTAAEITAIARKVFEEAVPGFVEDVRAEDSLDASGAPAIEIVAVDATGRDAAEGRQPGS